MPDKDRDQFDSLLRRALSSAPRRASRDCVDGETLAAWVSGGLPADEAGRVERHLADCGDCQAMLAAFVRTAPAETGPASSWRRWLLPVVVPLATAATVAIVVWPERPPAPSAPLERASRQESVVEAESPVLDQKPARQPLGIQQRVAGDRQESNAGVDGQVGAVTSDELREAATRRERIESARDADERANEAPVPALESRVARPEVQAPAADAREEVQPGPATGFAAARQAAVPLEAGSPDGVTQWRISGGRQVEVSVTRGEDWQAAELDSADSLTAISAPSGSVCWIVGREGAVYLSTDGRRFERLPFPESVDLVAVSASDASTATVTGADGRSWRTTDQGRSWR